MLTKDLLRYRNRKDRVYPTFIKTDDPHCEALAASMIGVFEKAPGSKVSDLEDEIAASTDADHPLIPALKKLLLDRTDELEDDGVIAQRRTELLRTAETLRKESSFATLAEFQAALAARQSGDFKAMQEQLYGDLPECRVIKEFESLTPTALLHRYNCAQVQGLLMVAQEVTVYLSGWSLAEKRRFFRCLKFQRLLTNTDIEEVAQETVCRLSGPLRIFQNSQSYGLRLAQFFPYILQMPKWRLVAEVKISGKLLTLELDHRVGILSHYKKLTPFIPPELTAFISAFNDRPKDFAATLGEEYLNLGRQSYCFPDVTLTSSSGQKIHLEIFHRWHVGQLAHRLKSLNDAPDQPLVIGVAEDIAEAKDIKNLLTQSEWFKVHGFIFKNLPTPKAVLEALKRHSTGSAQ